MGLAMAFGAAGVAAPARAASPGGAPYGTPAPAPAPAASPVPPTRRAPGHHLGDRLPLSRGAVGHDVRILQDFLTRVGHPLPTVGIFGPATQRALQAWQRSAGLPPTGVLDAGGLAALRAAIGRPAFAAPSLAAGPPPPPPASAVIAPGGLAVAPPGAPPAVSAAIAAANAIATLPYRYGGGHRSFTDTAYDCSGSVSFALHGAGLLSAPLDSTGLESWDVTGAGTWISVYANADHTFAVIAGLRFDTSGQRLAGTRWQPAAARAYAGFVVRHPVGL